MQHKNKLKVLLSVVDDVDEAEALQEAIRRSLGLTPMDPREHANSAEALLSMPSCLPRQNSMAPDDMSPPLSSGLSRQSSMDVGELPHISLVMFTHGELIFFDCQF